MKWFTKYFRPIRKEETLKAIQQHCDLIYQTNQALDRYEKAHLDGEETWLECSIDNVKLKKDKNSDTFSGTAHINCRT